MRQEHEADHRGAANAAEETSAAPLHGHTRYGMEAQRPPAVPRRQAQPAPFTAGRRAGQR